MIEEISAEEEQEEKELIGEHHNKWHSKEEFRIQEEEFNLFDDCHIRVQEITKDTLVLQITTEEETTHIELKQGDIKKIFSHNILCKEIKNFSAVIKIK